MVMIKACFMLMQELYVCVCIYIYYLYSKVFYTYIHTYIHIHTLTGSSCTHFVHGQATAFGPVLWISFAVS